MERYEVRFERGGDIGNYLWTDVDGPVQVYAGIALGFTITV